MNNHAEHYHSYLLWKRKVLWLTLAILGVCILAHGSLYYKLLGLQKTLAQIKTREQAAPTNNPAGTELEKIISQADQQHLYAWVSALIRTLPALVKIKELTYDNDAVAVTFVTCDRAQYIQCLELFESHMLLRKLRVEKNFAKDNQYFFIMKN